MTLRILLGVPAYAGVLGFLWHFGVTNPFSVGCVSLVFGVLWYACAELMGELVGEDEEDSG